MINTIKTYIWQEIIIIVVSLLKWNPDETEYCFSHIRHNGLKQTKWMILRWKYAKCGAGFFRKYTLEQQFLKTILVSETLSFNPITGQYSKKSTWPRSHDWQKATLASDSSMGNTQPVRSKASHIEKHCEVC